MKVLRPHVRNGKEVSDEVVCWDEDGSTMHLHEPEKGNRSTAYFTPGREIIITKSTLKLLHGIEA